MAATLEKSAGVVRDVNQSPERHDEFYIDDETVVLRVEDTLFRVHRHFLKMHSKQFSTMFSLTPPNETEGRTDEDPVHLPHTKSVDFERLLMLFYPKNIHDGDLTTVSEWSSILAVATRWEFEAHRALALSKLAQIATPVDRVLLAKEYDITEWLVPAYLTLCIRDEAISHDEGDRLGMRDVVWLSDLRQTIRGKNRVVVAERSIINMIGSKIV